MRANGVKAQHALRSAARKPAATAAVDRVLTDAETLDRLAALELAARRVGGATGDPELDAKIAAFDQSAALQAEMQREMNVLREMAMEQRKRDDEILKKWIALI